jgi:hypothetical protein
MKPFAALLFAFVVVQSLETRIVRLRPAAFPELPANLVQELQRRQCTIPQETFSKRRNNIIKRVGITLLNLACFLPSYLVSVTKR